MNVTINKNKNKSKNSKLNSLIKMLQILGKETEIKNIQRKGIQMGFALLL